MKAIFCTAMSVLMLATFGCNGSDFPEPMPVSGTVTYKGKPVEGAKVSFLSQTGGRSASGTTDASGQYALTTFNTNDGAIPDEYTITIAKFDTADTGQNIDVGAGEFGEDYGAMMDAAASGQSTTSKEASKLPAKYADPAESGLSRTVAGGQPNEFNFDLE